MSVHLSIARLFSLYRRWGGVGKSISLIMRLNGGVGLEN